MINFFSTMLLQSDILEYLSELNCKPILADVIIILSKIIFISESYHNRISKLSA